MTRPPPQGFMPSPFATQNHYRPSPNFFMSSPRPVLRPQMDPATMSHFMRQIYLNRLPPPGFRQPHIPSPVPTNCSYPNQNFSIETDQESVLASGEEEENLEFDPIADDWMSDQQKLTILRIRQRNLSTNNPYVNDYYFSVQWLRRKTAEYNRYLAQLGPAASARIKPPIFQIPAPVDAAELISQPESHAHMLNMRHRLVLTASDALSALAASSRDSTIAELADSSSNLGRATRSNFHTQRVIAELSVASVLTSSPNASIDQSMVEDGWSEVEACSHATLRSTGTTYFPGKSHYTATSVGYAPDLQELASSRKRRIILARIERMYSLILNLDETQFSLACIVVENN
ncbi:hypothetical protein Ciccas_001712 [Cichlidogyrus casuarinus]|uniref:Uncharacterized protein n=1 Tax=Cichlidogyrus casuarinus TaxID=1844966 RepID=A0ABD2QJ88_9PLAT